MRSLVNDRSVVIKKADKDLCVVEWDHEDYIAEVERQVGDVTVHKDVGFVKNLKNIDHIPHDAIMVTADVVGLYPSIPHDAGLEPLRKALDNRENKKISTDDLTKMTEFVLKNNYFEFN